MPTDSELRSWRDSWPPTQLRLAQPASAKGEPRPLLDDIDDDPLTYFLTPTPGLEDDGMDDPMMDFDAGIEDPSHAKDMVRSVSPSTLGGLAKPPSRSRSPDMDFDVPTPDEDDEEDYIRFSPGPSRFLSLPDFAIDGRRPRPRSPLFGRGINTLSSSSPSPSSPSPPPSLSSSPRGRAPGRGKFGPVRPAPTRSRPSHLWREPSPDVWSIEEETEEDVASEAGSLIVDVDDDDEERKEDSLKADDAAVKPKKKVRFVLPAEIVLPAGAVLPAEGAELSSGVGEIFAS